MRIPALRKTPSALSLGAGPDRRQQHTPADDQQPSVGRTPAAAIALASPTAILDAYGQPSIESVSAYKQQQQQRLACQNAAKMWNDDEDNQDMTACSHAHPPHPAYDEDATIRFPRASASTPTSQVSHPSPDTSKKLPRPPRPPRIRPLSEAVLPASTPSINHAHQSLNSDIKLDDDDLEPGAMYSSSSKDRQAYFDPRQPPSPERAASSSSVGHRPYLPSFASSSSIASRTDSLLVNGHSCCASSAPSPHIDLPSAGSPAGAYFVTAPSERKGQDLHQQDPYLSRVRHDGSPSRSVISEGNLDGQPSSENAAFHRPESLLKASTFQDGALQSRDPRASVYTTHTSASDWARERESEMRNSRSGVFDLEYDLHESRSGSSNEGHDVCGVQGSEQRNDGSAGHRPAISTASTSEFVAVSQPVSPASVSGSPMQQLQTQLLNTQERLKPPRAFPSSPTSPNSAGFGLGITSDDAIHPVGSSLPPSTTGSPDSSSFTDSQLPDQPYESVNIASSATSAPRSRWSTTRAYIRRNTASSVRSLHRQQSKSSLLDTRSPSFPSLAHSSSCTSLSEQYNHQQPAKHDESGSTGYNSESERAGYDTSLSQFGKTCETSRSTSMEKSMSSASSPIADYNATSSTRLSGLNSTRSIYASNANSYLSTESMVGDEREEIIAHGSHEKIESEPSQKPNSGLMDLRAGKTLTTRPTSQAVAMAESGKGKVTRIEPYKDIEDLSISPETTHLIFSGVMQPVSLSHVLSTSLPGLADKLLVLDISNCSLSAIPQSISLCANLEELNMSGNTQVSGTLPPFIKSLLSLRVLLADSCGLNAILHSFANLRHLHTLALRNNNLKYLPSWMSQLSESLEVLLLEDNPFHGDYADLVKSCSQLLSQSSPSTEVASPLASVHPSAEMFEDAENSFTSNASFRADSLDSQEQNDFLLPARIPAAAAIKPPRTSLLSRTSSVRLALSRSMSVSDDISASQSSSPVHSLLLADSSSQASTARRRASILKPMKSMGDLNASQPSIHELVVASDKENLPAIFPTSPAFPVSPSFSDTSTMESNTSSSSARPSPNLIQGPPSIRKSIAGSFAARRSRKGSRGMTALDFIASEVGEARGSRLPSHFPEAVSSANISAIASNAEEKGKDVRPGFLKKLSMGVTRRKKSNSALNSDMATPPALSSPPPPLPTEQAELGLGRPPFLNDGSLRSNSAPDVVGTTRGFSARENTSDGLPAMPRSFTTGLPDSPIMTWKSSIQSSIMESSRRYRKKSRPPIPESLLEMAKQEEDSKPARRRSYLMLNSVLPPVVSPGPLALTFSLSHGDDQTIHAKPQLQTLAEEQSPMTERGLSQRATVSPSVSATPAFNNWSVEERKAALAPLLAYLRDLDDLSRLSERKHTDPAPVMTRRTDSSRIPQRKASSAAVSVVSSLQPDRSSDYDSGRADSTALTSPCSVQGPIGKMKDDPHKRERIISEIISTEKSYIASLQELSTLYIAPASAPLREGSRETVVPQTERTLIFSVIESITQFHSTVLLPALERAAVVLSLGERISASSLDHAVLRDTAIEIAKVFIEHAAFMKLYHSYTVNFDTSLDRVALWESFKSASSATSTPPLSSGSGQRSGVVLSTNQRKRIRHLMKMARKDPRHSQLGLGGYLLMPIQRIPRYKMLLENLMECTPRVDCPDQAEPIISEALASMSHLATEMNERKRDNEGRQRLLYWQAQLSRFKSPLVQPHRTVLREGHMLLERVVKRDNVVVANLVAAARNEEAGPSSFIQIPILRVDRTRRKLIYVLCNDILILVLDTEGNSASTDKYETFTVLRLGKSLGGRDQPASTFGRPDRLRIVEDRAILYLFCPDAESAQTCRDSINRQSLQPGLSYRLMGE